MKIRVATEKDIPDITTLFYETIIHINSQDYTPDEIEVWASGYANKEKWTNRIKTHYFIVAVNRDKIIGFASLIHNGYLDLLYIHKEHQRQGVAQRLYNELEMKAYENKNELIYSDVSISAKEFFLHQGFVVEKQQLKKTGDKELINFRMTKKINK